MVVVVQVGAAVPFLEVAQPVPYAGAVGAVAGVGQPVGPWQAWRPLCVAVVACARAAALARDAGPAVPPSASLPAAS